MAKRSTYEWKQTKVRSEVNLLKSGELHSITIAHKKTEQLVLMIFAIVKTLNHRKFMNVRKLCERSFKCDVAGHSSFICLKMA